MESSFNYTKSFSTSSVAHCTSNGVEVPCPEFLNYISTPLITTLIVLYVVILTFLVIVPFWKIFKKAGKPGWASLIPIYNIIVLFQIAKKSPWLTVLMFIPIVNIIVMIILTREIARNFGKDIGFTVCLIVLPIVFFPILAYGKSEYTGNNTSITTI